MNTTTQSSCTLLTGEENPAVHAFIHGKSGSHVAESSLHAPRRHSQALGYDFNPGCPSEFPGVTRPESAESLGVGAAIHGQHGDRLPARQALQGEPRGSYERERLKFHV